MIDLCYKVTCDWCGHESHISKLMPRNKNLKISGAKKKYQSFGWIFETNGIIDRVETIFCSQECKELFKSELKIIDND